MTSGAGDLVHIDRRGFLGGLSLAFIPAFRGWANALPNFDQGVGPQALSKSIQGIPDDGVLAYVDDAAVSARDLIGILFLTSPDTVFGALEQAMRRKLVAAESDRLAVTVPEEKLEKFLEAILKRQVDGFHLEVGPDRDFETYLNERYGMSMESYRAILSDVALENLLFERVVRFAGRQTARAQFRLYVSSELEKAKAAREKLEEGANFAALAKKESEDRESAPSGGLYPPVPVHIPNVVVDAVKDLEIGKFTQIGTETRLGKTIYWIARLEARLPADTRTYPEQSADIEADLEQARVHEFEMRLWDQEIRTRHKIKVRLGRA